MAGSHPYISGAGNISQMVSHLRKSFPQSITSETVKKLGLAPNNESYVINALQFIGIIDETGKKSNIGAKIFSYHKDEEFTSEFAKLVENAYSSLFDLHGEHTWELSTEELITFFRQSDQTSDAIGKRQAATFKMFAGISGHGEPATPRATSKNGIVTVKKNQKQKLKAKEMKASELVLPNDPKTKPITYKDVGLTVRIEINLPADSTKETYDSIFKSIKENLIDAT